ncbi:hypothetical protein F5878DRAFT_693306 [Lentinula raphanica]|uniref:Uncharacterized protein n=1 Tax=Lentinula raphanica TaxID=153919 RepID=A0AA38P329_9AGAR|nr:hypothetical protein F5878DRAFT_693306 [Lentinula raphanica]
MNTPEERLSDNIRQALRMLQVTQWTNYLSTIIAQPDYISYINDTDTWSSYLRVDHLPFERMETFIPDYPNHTEYLESSPQDEQEVIAHEVGLLKIVNPARGISGCPKHEILFPDVLGFRVDNRTYAGLLLRLLHQIVQLTDDEVTPDLVWSLQQGDSADKLLDLEGQTHKPEFDALINNPDVCSVYSSAPSSRQSLNDYDEQHHIHNSQYSKMLPWEESKVDFTQSWQTLHDEPQSRMHQDTPWNPRIQNYSQQVPNQTITPQSNNIPCIQHYHGNSRRTTGTLPSQQFIKAPCLTTIEEGPTIESVPSDPPQQESIGHDPSSKPLRDFRMSETQKSTNHRQQRVTGWKKTKGKVPDNNAAENSAKQDALVDNSGLTDAQNDSNILHRDISPHRKRQDPTIKYVNPLQNGNGPGARTSSHPHVLSKRKEYGEGNIKTPIRDFCAQVLENQENHDEEKYPSTAAHYYKTPSQHSPINSSPKITQRYSFEEHDSTSCDIQPDTHPSGYTNSNHSRSQGQQFQNLVPSVHSIAGGGGGGEPPNPGGDDGYKNDDEDDDKDKSNNEPKHHQGCNCQGQHNGQCRCRKSQDGQDDCNGRDGHNTCDCQNRRSDNKDSYTRDLEKQLRKYECDEMNRESKLDINKPTMFSGEDRTAWRKIKENCENFFTAKPRIYSNDISRVSFAASYMSGPAKRYYQNLMQRQRAGYKVAELDNWDNPS